MKNSAVFTVRVPSSLHQRAKEILKKENKSLNAIVNDLLQEWLKKEQEKLLFEAFSIISEENIEYAVEAQKESILADEQTKKV